MNLKEIYTETIKSRGLRKILNRKLTEHELIYGEFEILFMLFKQNKYSSLQPSKISSALKCEPAAVSRLIKSLHKKNLVSYEHGDHDRRQVLVGLTDEGSTKIGEIVASQT